MKDNDTVIVVVSIYNLWRYFSLLKHSQAHGYRLQDRYLYETLAKRTVDKAMVAMFAADAHPDIRRHLGVMVTPGIVLFKHHCIVYRAYDMEHETLDNVVHDATHQTLSTLVINCNLFVMFLVIMYVSF